MLQTHELLIEAKTKKSPTKVFNFCGAFCLNQLSR